MTVKYLVGDTRAVLATLEAHAYDLILSSPPFLALRSYLPADHPDKAHEIGSEATPGEFIDVLLDVVEACARVLAPHGSLVFELGDTYAGSGGAGGDYNADGLREGQPKFRQHNMAKGYGTASDGSKRTDYKTKEPGLMYETGGSGWPLDKCLTLVPQLFAYALAYGHNPLTGRTTDRWRVRNIVRWVRPNPPVGALGDKYRPATSELIVACKARDRYFDLDAVREPYADITIQKANCVGGDGPKAAAMGRMPERHLTHAGAPPLDWWQIPTAPYKGSHYATWPPALCVKPILSMCPERVCTTCGKPSRRIVGEAEYIGREGKTANRHFDSERVAEGVNDWHSTGDRTAHRVAPTVGWTDCGHDTWRPGHVLDPFAGSATTLAVAHGHSRDATGIDLDPRNAELAYGRLGLFLTVHDMREAVA